LVASKEDLEKCKTKNAAMSDLTINDTYAKFAESKGFKLENSFR